MAIDQVRAGRTNPGATGYSRGTTIVWQALQLGWG
jgi:hypothetical protein